MPFCPNQNQNSSRGNLSSKCAFCCNLTTHFPICVGIWKYTLLKLTCLYFKILKHTTTSWWGYYIFKPSWEARGNSVDCPQFKIENKRNCEVHNTNCWKISCSDRAVRGQTTWPDALKKVWDSMTLQSPTCNWGVPKKSSEHYTYICFWRDIHIFVCVNK